MALILIGNISPIEIVRIRLVEQYMAYTLAGTFKLIESEISELSEPELSQRFESISALFEFPLEFSRLSDFQDRPRVLKRLQDHSTVLLEPDGEIMGKRLGNTHWVVSLGTEETEEQSMHRVIQGPIALLKQKLNTLKKSEYHEALLALQVDYQFPIRLQSDPGDLPQAIYKQLIADPAIISYTDNGDGDELMAYARLESTGAYLTVGPLEGDTQYLIYLIGAIILIVLLSILLSFAVWVWPTLRDLKRLNAHAKAFGTGELSSRVELKRGTLVSELGETFNTMAGRIARLLQSHQHLTNSVAHDLRTPLARLRFALEILQSEDCSPEETIRYRDSIASSIDTLEYLINQTLIHARYNRVASHKNFNAIDCSELVRSEFEQHALAHPELATELVIESEMEAKKISIDGKAMQRALSNLLSNAARHAHSRVKVGLYATADEHCEISVEDDGEGLESQYFDSIFQPFFQIDNDARSEKPGHGLGLAIVQQIAHWHQGEAQISRSDLGGVRLVIRWPCD